MACYMYEHKTLYMNMLMNLTLNLVVVSVCLSFAFQPLKSSTSINQISLAIGPIKGRHLTSTRIELKSSEGFKLKLYFAGGTLDH